MKRVYTPVFGLLLAGLVSCGNAGQSGTPGDTDTAAVSAPDAVAMTDTSAAPEDSEAGFNVQADAARIVFGMVLSPEKQSGDAEQLAVSKCTPALIAALREMNDYDDGGIAWWGLRTMAQDGPEDSSEIISVTPDGHDAVILEYSDMGLKASTRLIFVRQDDGWKINSAVVTYAGESRTVGQ